MKMDKSKFLNLIREELESYGKIGQEPEVISEEKDKPKEIPLEDWLPRMRISENFGDRKSADRTLLNMFVTHIDQRLKGEAMLERRIKAMQKFIENPKAIECPSDIAGSFARIIVLEMFASILNDFSAGAGGYILEAFFAGLSGKRGFQLPEPGQQKNIHHEIADFKAGNGMAYGLKLLRAGESKSKATKIDGSLKNMLNHLLGKTSQNFSPPDEIRYLIVYRSGDDLEFLKFQITAANIGDLLAKKSTEGTAEEWSLGWFGEDDSGKPYKLAGKNAKQLMDLLDAHEAKIGKYTTAISLLKKVLDPKKLNKLKKGKRPPDGLAMLESLLAADDWEMIKQVIQGVFNGEAINDATETLFLRAIKKLDDAKPSKKTQFSWTRTEAEGLARFSLNLEEEAELFAKIPLGKENLKAAAQACVDKVSEQLIPLYKAMKDLTDSSNMYFLSEKPDEVSKSATNMVKITHKDLPIAVKNAGVYRETKARSSSYKE